MDDGATKHLMSRRSMTCKIAGFQHTARSSMSEAHLAHLDHLQGDVEADGDEVAIQHKGCHKGVDPCQYRIAGIEGCGRLLWG